MARPSSLTPEVRAKLVDSMRIGSYQIEAAHYAGISEKTLITWLQTGRRDIAEGNADTPHAILVHEIEEAEAKAVIGAVSVMQRAAAQGDWKAAVAWLSRRHPDRWGSKVNVSVEAQNLADEIKNLVGQLTPDETGTAEDGDGDGPGDHAG